MDSLIKKAGHKGYALSGRLGQQFEPVANFKEAVEAAVSSTRATLHFRMDLGWESFLVPWSRGILKMALGLGACALGRTWAFSAAADKLRSCLVCDAAALKRRALTGTVVGKNSPEIAELIDIQPGRHTLAVLPHEREMVAFISLSGGELFDGIINLGNGPADIKLVNDTLPATWKCVFHIEPVTRSLTTLTMSDVDSRQR